MEGVPPPPIVPKELAPDPQNPDKECNQPSVKTTTVGSLQQKEKGPAPELQDGLDEEMESNDDDQDEDEDPTQNLIPTLRGLNKESEDDDEDKVILDNFSKTAKGKEGDSRAHKCRPVIAYADSYD